MNIVSFHKQDLQLVIRYLSIAIITGLFDFSVPTLVYMIRQIMCCDSNLLIMNLAIILAIILDDLLK